jgi:hypothetical protein
MSVAEVSNLLIIPAYRHSELGKMVDIRALDLWFHLRLSMDAL